MVAERERAKETLSEWMLEEETESIMQRTAWQRGHWACKKISKPSTSTAHMWSIHADENCRELTEAANWLNVNINIAGCLARWTVWEIRLFFLPFLRDEIIWHAIFLRAQSRRKQGVSTEGYEQGWLGRGEQHNRYHLLIIIYGGREDKPSVCLPIIMVCFLATGCLLKKTVWHKVECISIFQHQPHSKQHLFLYCWCSNCQLNITRKTVSKTRMTRRISDALLRYNKRSKTGIDLSVWSWRKHSCIIIAAIVFPCPATPANIPLVRFD